MRKKKDSSREKEQLESQRPMNTYHEWLWYHPAHFHEHPIHAKKLRSEKKLGKVKKKIALVQNKTAECSNFSQGALQFALIQNEMGAFS